MFSTIPPPPSISTPFHHFFRSLLPSNGGYSLRIPEVHREGRSFLPSPGSFWWIFFKWHQTWASQTEMVGGFLMKFGWICWWMFLFAAKENLDITNEQEQKLIGKLGCPGSILFWWGSPVFCSKSKVVVFFVTLVDCQINKTIYLIPGSMFCWDPKVIIFLLSHLQAFKSWDVPQV